MKKNKNKKQKIRNIKLKKNQWYCAFALNGSSIYFGPKYWNKIQKKYKDEKIYIIVVLNNRELKNGFKNNFKEYFSLLGDITRFIDINNNKIEIIVDLIDDVYSELEDIMELQDNLEDIDE